MAKSKKKKKKEADFQKVKLKVGKAKLSKGNNITNLSFKTRQIQLTQMIRDGEGVELVTRKNLSIPVSIPVTLFMTMTFDFFLQEKNRILRMIGVIHVNNTPSSL